MLRVLIFRPTLADGGADRVTVTILQHLDRRRFAPQLALVRRAGVLADEVPADVRVHELAAPRLALAAPALARVIRAEDPDVVVCTAGGANVVAVAAHRLARSRARLVLSERSAIRRADRSPLRGALEVGVKRLAYRRANLVTAVSEGVADDLVEQLGLARDRVRVVYNPMLSSDALARAAEPVDHAWFTDGAPTVLAVGRLVDIKDYPTLLAAVAHARLRLAVLGEGPKRAALEARAKELGIGDTVEFLGYDKNPYRYMRRATVLAQSSIAEGLPGALIQSLACGTPVVATDCDHGPREVVRDGVDGFLVRVGDAAALGDRLAQIAGDPALRERLGAAGASGAARFTVASAMPRYEEAIAG